MNNFKHLYLTFIHTHFICFLAGVHTWILRSFVLSLQTFFPVICRPLSEFLLTVIVQRPQAREHWSTTSQLKHALNKPDLLDTYLTSALCLLWHIQCTEGFHPGRSTENTTDFLEYVLCMQMLSSFFLGCINTYFFSQHLLLEMTA